MNHYEQYISRFLFEQKELSLEKIGLLKTTGNSGENQLIPVGFTFDKRAVTSPEFIDYISGSENKNRRIVESDVEYHLRQAREFLNIGKPYEIINAGFIKKNNKGEYVFLLASQPVKMSKNIQESSSNKQVKKSGTSLVQLFTLLIVLAIIGGLGYEAYQFFITPKQKNAIVSNEEDSVDQASPAIKDTAKKEITGTVADTSKTITSNVNNNSDSVNVKYFFETTSLVIRATSRTAKLVSFGNIAGYDSSGSGNTKMYSLYLVKKSLPADTTRIRDSLSKFLQKPVYTKVE